MTADLRAALPADYPRKECRWKVDAPFEDEHFEADCGGAWCMVESSDPADAGYNFCPTCGGRIVFVPPEPEEEDDDE